MMNKRIVTVQQDQIDLLAEDELSVQERQLLFQQLESDPSGWKRCALALLEQQALQKSLAQPEFGNVHEADEPRLTDSNSERLIVQLDRRYRQALWAVAASVLVSLTLGVVIGRLGSEPTVAETQPSTEQAAQAFVSDLMVRDRDLLLQYEVSVRSIGATDCKLLAFFGTKHNGEAKIYPIIESKSLENQLAKIVAPRIPRPEVQELAKRGWRVNSQRQFVSVGLVNGIRKTVPIGMLNYDFVGRETF